METKFCLEKVQLGDLDCALQLIGTHLLNHKIGNVMWQSPEGRLRRGMGKHSECLFVLAGTEPFNLDFESLSVELEQAILHELLSNFGPLPDELVKHVDSEKAGEHLKDLWKMIEEDEERAEGYEPFEQWTEADYPNLDNDAKRLILRLTNLDPGKRAEMVEITTNPYWVRGWFHGYFETEECSEDDAKQRSNSREINDYSLANICNLRT
ncbi:hypothetical protein BHYA_0008g00650 [Botrytis hyacinthi]|uniref:Protein kinase domain-containing protein n=1 Tax=Botrytis hyacinthi TaxID=278943 RepID=A0A4Z1GZR9_9HELO|nr:hypothetical protein BHYA_0008g00650 [Botrytis hyacinthi]